MTGRDLVKGALRLLGVLAEGEAPSADALTDGLEALEGMLGSWSTEGLMIHAVVREEFTLTSGQQVRTVGATGNFVTTRPVDIESATIEDQSASPTCEYPMRILGSQEWAAKMQKDQTADIPTELYIEKTTPNLTMNIWPVPSAANKIVLYSKKPFSDIEANTTITLPPGGERTLRYNLAIELAPEYGKPVPAEVAMIAAEAKGNYKRANLAPNYMDTGLGSMGGAGGFNILTGE